MDRSWTNPLPLLLVGAATLLATGLALALGTQIEQRWAGHGLWAVSALLVLSITILILQQRRLDRMQREFAIGLSHQVRTPLTHIRTFNEMLLLEHERSESERQQWLEVVGREAERLGKVVENLLLVAHHREAQRFPGRRATDLGSLIEDVVASYATDAAARSTNIIVESSSDVSAIVDAHAVQQAVANLLDNAIRHGPEGQTVSVKLEARADAIVISVADQGLGIARRDRRRIWKPFVRLQKTASPEGGCGLGLAAVQRVATAHGGNAYMEDAPGGINRFCIALPTSGST